MNSPVICRCEEVLLSDILTSIDQGTTTAKEIKLSTRAGMGICQGKICRPLLEKILSEYMMQDDHVGSPLTHNFPARPITLEELSMHNLKE